MREGAAGPAAGTGSVVAEAAIGAVTLPGRHSVEEHAAGLDRPHSEGAEQLPPWALDARVPHDRGDALVAHEAPQLCRIPGCQAVVDERSVGRVAPVAVGE